MGTSTEAVFTAVGIDSSVFTDFLSAIFGQTVNFGLDVLEIVWPFLLVLALLSIIIGICYAALHRRR